MDDNPWLASSLEDFTFICCPECVYRCQDAHNFQNHALKNHPQSKCFFKPEKQVKKASKKKKVEIKQEPEEYQ